MCHEGDIEEEWDLHTSEFLKVGFGHSAGCMAWSRQVGTSHRSPCMLGEQLWGECVMRSPRGDRPLSGLCAPPLGSCRLSWPLSLRCSSLPLGLYTCVSICPKASTRSPWSCSLLPVFHLSSHDFSAETLLKDDNETGNKSSYIFYCWLPSTGFYSGPLRRQQWEKQIKFLLMLSYSGGREKRQTKHYLTNWTLISPMKKAQSNVL